MSNKKFHFEFKKRISKIKIFFPFMFKKEIIVTNSTDGHTHILDEATMTKLHWRIKGSVMPDGDTRQFNTSKHSRRLQSQIGRPLGPIKTPITRQKRYYWSIDCPQWLESRTTYIRPSHHQQKVQEIYTDTTMPISF